MAARPVGNETEDVRDDDLRFTGGQTSCCERVVGGGGAGRRRLVSAAGGIARAIPRGGHAQASARPSGHRACAGATPHGADRSASGSSRNPVNRGVKSFNRRPTYPLRVRAYLSGRPSPYADPRSRDGLRGWRGSTAGRRVACPALLLVHRAGARLVHEDGDVSGRHPGQRATDG